MTRTFAPLLVAAALVACTPPPPPPVTLPPPPTEGAGPTVFAAAAPAVVRVEAAGRVGAGFLITPAGELLTTAHVVRDAFSIDVFVPERSGPIPARVVGVDAPLDLALLQLELPSDASPLPALALAEAGDALEPGEAIWTLGHPEGYDWTLASGIISRVHPDDPDQLLTSLPASPGSSGGPVLRHRDGAVRVVGLLSHVLSHAPGQSFALASSGIRARLDALRAGAREGFSDAAAFVGTLPNRAPIVHQIIVARRIVTDTRDRIEAIFGNLEVARVPTRQTLEVRTTWRYNLTGSHRFRYRVLRFPEGGAPELIHLGPLRDWALEDRDASYVHDAEIDVTFEEPGLYAVTVETDGVLSAVFPFLVWTEHPESPAVDWDAIALPYQARPGYHAIVLAAAVEQAPLSPPDDNPDDPAPEPDARLASAAPVSISNPFNLIRANHFPSRAVFSSWVRWGYSFSGEHTFRLVLVDARGDTIAEGQRQSFSLPSDTASFEHIAEWDVDFPAAGLYVILCYTDGAISRALPLWVRED